jgi:hypothetical protein
MAAELKIGFLAISSDLLVEKPGAKHSLTSNSRQSTSLIAAGPSKLVH